ncbi:cytochrome P450 [Glutamicibacter protophormiae]|uniref:cytochrome P450 n=1 Tax=Glutamicibacter protophormiae TaxID=37930 RepID=UPI002A83F772|nr:cytochrome P450 [Glutamicibacter protophormiae]WPR64112.1 cytochrome P450 [Glutamicibacter protophormiae]WPR67606.1 cytochrome P450 [Glutamicibacter protophormiae]
MPAQEIVQWDPKDPEALANQIAAYDRLRLQCPVTHSDFLGYSILRHEDVLTLLGDHESFSDAVSARLTVPNGMDPPHHTISRQVNDRYFTPGVMERFEPVCRSIAAELIDALPRAQKLNFSEIFAEIYALRGQSPFLGWPADVEEPLRRWTIRNLVATGEQNHTAMKQIAMEFDGYIRQLLSDRRRAGENAPRHLTTSLMNERVHDRKMTDEELVSLLRNWTVGELSTISASVGILANLLSQARELWPRLRSNPRLVDASTDEVLRSHAPLVSNRRVTTKDVEISGVRIPAGKRVSIMWASANRDESVFGDPDDILLDRDPSLNLLYGAGIHNCPGAPLARLELRVLIEELILRVDRLVPIENDPPVRAHFPGSGFSKLPLIIW